MMKKLIISFFFLVAMIFAHSQSPKLDWVKQIGSTFDDNGKSVLVDGTGNIYVSGIFNGLVDFDPGPGVYNLNSEEGKDFILKLTPSGHFVWAKHLGGDVESIAIDRLGNIYTTGKFNDTVDFDPGAGVYNLIANQYNTMFISKLDGDGNLVWVKQIESIPNYIIDENSIQADISGNVYINGDFFGSVDFDPGSGTKSFYTGMHFDIFILKLRENGDFAWVRRMASDDIADGMRCMTLDDSANIYTTGYFMGETDFDPDSSKSYILTATGFKAQDMFVLKLDSNGNFIWAKQIISPASSRSIVADRWGNVIVTGTFNGKMDFDPNSGVSFLISAAVDNDIFILKLNNSGDLVWVKSMEGNMSAEALAIAVGANGSIFTAGYFGGTVDFDPGAGKFLMTSAKNSNDMFIAKVTSSGDFAWAKKISGSGGGAEGHSILVTASEEIYTTGKFYNTVDFNPDSTSIVNLASQGMDDIFIQKMGAIVSNFSIYPNPTRGVFKVDIMYPGIKAEIMIYDALGSLINKETSSSQSNRIDLSQQEDGIYFVKVVYEGGGVKTGKLVKEE